MSMRALCSVLCPTEWYLLAAGTLWHRADTSTVAQCREQQAHAQQGSHGTSQLLVGFTWNGNDIAARHLCVIKASKPE